MLCDLQCYECLGTWVTFGSQVTDEVSSHRYGIIFKEIVPECYKHGDEGSVTNNNCDGDGVDYMYDHNTDFIQYCYEDDQGDGADGL